MKPPKPYRPISCDFHSELELLALRRTVCPVIFLDENGNEQTIESAISDLFTRNKEEFLILRDGKLIRLDRLVSVNGMLLKDYC